MTTALDRGLKILENLAGAEHGRPLHEIADSLKIPRSAAHRLLAELVLGGYVHQTGELGNYVLSLKIVSVGLAHLEAMDLVSMSKPVLEQLAHETAELVRLAIVDGEDMVWVSRHQGVRSGLRYDPDSGRTVTLSCSATGFAWMAHIPEEEALQKILRQGIAPRAQYGPKAPQTIDEIRAELRKTRLRGFATATDTHVLGIASVAAPVYVGKKVVGSLSVSGPTPRLPEMRLLEIAPRLLEATKRITNMLDASDGRMRIAN